MGPGQALRAFRDDTMGLILVGDRAPYRPDHQPLDARAFQLQHRAQAMEQAGIIVERHAGPQMVHQVQDYFFWLSFQ